MSVNGELAEIFGRMAAILELTGADRFRVAAHARVERVLKDLTLDVATLVDEPDRLTAIEGIGAKSAKKIVEYVQTGHVTEHDKLLEEVPEGLLDVLSVPGLGPKTVRVLWEKAGVTDLGSLRAALDDGSLESVPRMGAKTIENIRDALAFAERTGTRMRLGQALPVAEGIVERLAAVPGTRRIEYAGSLRRGRETIGDIDVLAASDDPAALGEAFRAMPEVERILVGGSTKSSVRLAGGTQVDLRIVPDEVFGAALMYFTGSKAHNVLLRERAVKRGCRLNEYGLFPDDGEDAPPQTRGVTPLAAATEPEIYAALDLPWIPPELREDRGEMDAEMPELVEIGDIRCDLHTHTTASDGKMSIDELAVAAKARGYHTIAVTDHSKSSAQANGLDADALRRHVDDIRAADARHDGIAILAGSEVDILADGHLDYDDDVLALLDIVVASPHVALRQPAEKATARLLRAITHPLVHVLGHPTGRMINRREGLPIDIDRIAAAAAEHDTALEINANAMRLDLRDVHVRSALAAGALIAINTDAHAPVQFEQLRYGVLTARRGGLTKAHCVNAWSAKRLRAWLAKGRSG
jgi:DNA polymerase (family 10)